ncbi:oxysterol-binding protein-related protein 1C-like isoform X2 [Solanum lycopersicum]|uniref:oxysterol-binding protein-related protein 1C-like isoform X2 n=1 Tax=Solanum lycopersicum TaxID=4081 RepID=UPI0008FEB354|nr:oxysterol-binding protein-related protein 1C-like isoform X2 [Solanum lycopersicum]
MHPFCCVPTINNNCQSSPLPMAPPPAPEFTRSADSLNRSASGSYNHNWTVSNSNHHRHRSLTESSSSTPAIFTSLSRPTSMREVIQLTCAASAGDQVKINDIVGNGISGILHKWVNYGKGWRPRWFVLQDGVLSYYKIHGPDRIVVNSETEKGSKVIGEVSLRRISRNKTNATSQARRKPVGEVHLKVSSIRESRSDDRRFSIFTGTKRLHLRAETREDRIAWMEALQAVKDMFPRMSNSELMAPVDDVAVSTDKLRQQLMKEGVSESAIQESELIMRNEFASLQNQLMLLKQKHRMLMDTLRQLETEKVDLENTVVDESQRQCKEVGPSAQLRQDKYSASASESEDDNERVDAAEEDTDDEENTFFDTKDFLSSSSFKSSGSDFRTSSFSSDDDDLYAYASDESVDPIIRSAGTKFPYVKRRKKLPNPIEKEKGVSLWSMIKDNIGKDLTKVCLPVYFNEPLSSLQKSFEDLEYSYLLDRASEWGRRGDNLMRILNVAAFAVSAYASTEGRICKPFNPLLGETYEAEYPDKGLRFFSEKVSHHPMIIACHCEGTGWKFWGDSNLKSKFWGRSIQLDPVGILTLEFDDGEIYQWSKVTTSIYNLILGKLYCDHYGTMRIQGNRNYSCKLKFKEQSIIDRNPHQVQGIVQDRSGKTVATLFGKWDESMHYVNGDFSLGKGFDSLSEAHLLWKRSKPPKDPTRYNLTRFAITMNELIPGLKDKLPPTDSRLRPDQRCLENGEYDRANSEKLRLEERQRQARKMQERGWKPQWFAKEKGGDSYNYIGGYWEAREKGKWEACPDIFGHIPCDQM